MGNANSKRHEELLAPLAEEDSEGVPSFTCEICIEPTPSINKFTYNNDLCAHPFCTDCVINYIQIKVADDRIADVRCPAVDCDRSFDPLQCRPAMPPQLFDEWCDVLCEKALLGLERCYCPNQDCSALVVNECGENVKRSLCPNCKRLFCFQCKVPWHAGYRCEESGERRDGNDMAFGVLAERKKWMRCPQCHHCVERISGCITVKCRCRTSFCYKCGRKVHELLHSCDCNRISWTDYLCVIVFLMSILACILFIICGYFVNSKDGPP